MFFFYWTSCIQQNCVLQLSMYIRIYNISTKINLFFCCLLCFFVRSTYRKKTIPRLSGRPTGHSLRLWIIHNVFFFICNFVFIWRFFSLMYTNFILSNYACIYNSFYCCYSFIIRDMFYYKKIIKIQLENLRILYNH